MLNKKRISESRLYLGAVPLFLAVMYLLLHWFGSALTSVDLHVGSSNSGVITESTPPTMPDARDDVLILFLAAVAGLVLVAAMRWMLEPDEAGPNTLPGAWRGRTLMSAGFFVISVAMASLLTASEAENLSRTSDYGNPAQWWASAHLLIAGSAEEPFFSALPIVLLFGFVPRVRPWMLGLVFASSALFRASIHLYQGTGPALSAFVWGAAAIYIYYRLRSLTGLVLAHTAWNALVISNNGHYAGAQVVIGGCIAAAALWAIYRLSNMSRDPLSSDQAYPPPASSTLAKFPAHPRNSEPPAADLTVAVKDRD